MARRTARKGTRKKLGRKLASHLKRLGTALRRGRKGKSSRRSRVRHDGRANRAGHSRAAKKGWKSRKKKSSAGKARRGARSRRRGR